MITTYTYSMFTGILYNKNILFVFRWIWNKKKFYPGPRIEPGPPALRASALTTTPSSTLVQVVLDDVMVSALARKARDPGSILVPG